jgi:hypothetical protein
MSQSKNKVIQTVHPAGTVVEFSDNEGRKWKKSVRNFVEIVHMELL